jgi:glycosyltransferase involved in cell wall biosynthesis
VQNILKNVNSNTPVLRQAIVITHPEFSLSYSMPRYARMITDALQERGVHATVWTAKPLFRRIISSGKMLKWFGYIDQYVVFPIVIFFKVRKVEANTIFIFCDQALGPWVPLIAKRIHVVHCHDFLALRSALGEIPQNSVSLTGRLYQFYIRRGLGKAKNFISISESTKMDLEKYHIGTQSLSKVVHNGLNFQYQRKSAVDAFKIIAAAGISVEEAHGYFIHVGRGQWYKNTEGILRLYTEYCNQFTAPESLLMVSPYPNGVLAELVRNVPSNGRVLFLQDLDNEVIEALYSCAVALIFPSFFEGFGWPIIEALACGCEVITTNAMPMTEVGGAHATYIEASYGSDQDAWLQEGVERMRGLVAADNLTKELRADAAIEWASSFSNTKAKEGYFNVYEEVFAATITDKRDEVDENLKGN